MHNCVNVRKNVGNQIKFVGKFQQYIVNLEGKFLQKYPHAFTNGLKKASPLLQYSYIGGKPQINLK